MGEWCDVCRKQCSSALHCDECGTYFCEDCFNQSSDRCPHCVAPFAIMGTEDINYFEFFSDEGYK